MGIKCADLKMNFCSRFLYTAFCVNLVEGKATDRHVLARMIREIEMSGDWFGCVAFPYTRVTRKAVKIYM